MKESSGWEKQVDETLNSLDGIQRAKANPFLFTRVQARLDQSSGVWGRIAGFISRPVFAFGVVAVLLSVNIGIAISYEHPKETVSKVSDEQAFGSEYATGDFSITDSNTDN